MKSHRVTGGGGARIHVVESGSPNGPPVLFIHGYTQCSLAWSRQLTSDLADGFRLLAMDMRGHGQSDKPADAYGDSRLWADDVHAVMQALDLHRPVLCAWSYGGLVILDYIRHYGEDNVGAIHLVAAITKLGRDEAVAAISPEFLALVPSLFSTDAAESVRGLEALLRLCLTEPPSITDLYLMLGYNVSAPPHVRQALLSRTLDNDDLLPKIRRPVLITHGARDAVVKPITADRHASAIRHAETHIMPGAGHAPFWENAPEFNQRLRSFSRSID